MSKKSKIAKNKRQKDCIVRYAEIRNSLKLIISNKSLPIQERYAAQVKMMKLPRDSSVTRKKNICSITGKPRGVYRHFGLCRNVIRELGSFGLLPGVIKSSW